MTCNLIRKLRRCDSLHYYAHIGVTLFNSVSAIGTYFTDSILGTTTLSPVNGYPPRHLLQSL